MNNKKEISKLSHPQNLFLISVFVASMVFFGFTFTFDDTDRDYWLKEDGIIETFSAVFYFMSALLFLYWGGLRNLKKYYYFPAMVIIFGMRELDFDKRFTTFGVLQIKLYSSDNVPMLEKFIGLVIISIIVYMIFVMVKNHFRDFLVGLRNFNPVHLGVLSIFSLLVISKTLDGIGRKLNSIGISIDKQTSVHFVALEEILELVIPVFFISTFYTYFGHLRSRK